MFARLRISSDWLWLVAALGVIGVVTTVEARGSATNRTPLSVANPLPNGALGAYRWLTDLGYHTQRVSSLQLSAFDPRTTTLFFLTESAPIPESEAPQLFQWIRRGGRVVVSAGKTSSRVLRTVGITTRPGTVQQVRMVEPLLGPGPSKLSSSEPLVLHLGRGATVARTADGPIVVRTQLGRGDLWSLSSPLLLSNRAVAKAGDPWLLHELVGRRPRAVIFVEMTLPASHASATGNWLTGMPWGIATLFALATVLFYRFLSGWRLGPPIRDAMNSSRPATEYVIAIAGLLQRGRKRQEVVKMYQEQARRRLERSEAGRSQLEARDFEELGPAFR